MKTGLKLTLAFAAWILAGSTGHAQEKITLKIADYLPSGHIIYTAGLKLFMEAATKETNGRVEFQYFPSEQLGKAKDMLTLVQSGTVDVAEVLPSYVSEKLPFTTIIELPGLYASSCQGTQAFLDATRQDGVLAEEFLKNGVRNILPVVYPPADLLVASKEVTKIEHWNGLKVRAAGGPTEVAVAEMGGVALKMSATDIYQALSRGTVDAALIGATSAEVYGLDTVIKSLTTDFSLGSVVNTYVFNEQKWQSLPEDIRAGLQRAGDAASLSLCATLDTQRQKDLERMQGMGITINRLDEAENSAWAKQVSGLIGEWATRLNMEQSQVQQVYDGLRPAN